MSLAGFIATAGLLSELECEVILIMDSGKGRERDRVEIHIPCKAEYVHTIRRTLAEFAESLDMPTSAVEDMQIATSEAVTNIIKHAYTGLDSVPPLKVRYSQRRNGLLVEIVDSGRGFVVPKENLPMEACIDKEGGLGITLIRSLMDSVCFDSRPDHGTRIRMMKIMEPCASQFQAAQGAPVSW